MCEWQNLHTQLHCNNFAWTCTESVLGWGENVKNIVVSIPVYPVLYLKVRELRQDYISGLSGLPEVPRFVF